MTAVQGAGSTAIEEAVGGGRPRSLLILRHGQAGSAVRDFDRPLTGRGRRAAEAVGDWLLEAGLIPERVIASAARRTTETARLCCGRIGLPEERITLSRALYGADCDDWLAELAALPEAARVVLLVGHNPTLSWLAGRLSGEAISLATADLAWLTTEGGWSAPMRLQRLVRSRALTGA
ncbi:MAG: histidine phosphatase family protein [Zetaproteobacteria bacterium]|nr:MAG: histidine phosphatase family protein [Zetaproteobacteria bacterium]